MVNHLKREAEKKRGRGKIAGFDAVNIGGAKWLSLNLKKICSKRLIV